MKKILSIALAVVMVMALTLTVFADTVWEYSSPTTVTVGWTTLFEKGSDEANAFFEAIKTEGAVIEMIGTDLTEADKTDEEAWFQICTQDAANWTSDGDSKTEGIGETYAFTDEGYMISIPADAYNAMLSACAVPTSNMQLVLNAGGSWTKAATKIVIRVVTGDEAAAAPAEEAPADTTAEAPAETEAPAASEAPKTGLALAVIPAVMALAAAAVSKKR